MIATTLAAISGNQLMQCFLWLLIAAVSFFLGNWFIGYAQIKDPVLTIARIIMGLLVVAFVINALLWLTGNPFIG